MQNKIFNYILTFAISLGCSATYAAANPSLWGGIDAPVAPVQQLEHEQKQAEEQAQIIANQKTVCEVLSAQPSLGGDTASADKVRAAVQQAYKSALPEYKMFFVSADAANDLYAKFREQYLTTNCGVPAAKKP